MPLEQIKVIGIIHPGEAYRVRLVKNSTGEKGQNRFYCFEGLNKDLMNKFRVAELKHTLSHTQGTM